MWVPLVLAAHVFSASMVHAIDDIGTRIVAEGRAPGVAIGVVEDGRIVYARGFGEAQRDHHAHFVPETQTYIGGVSESFTAAAVLLLQQDGKLKLTDPIVKYVPELRNAHGATVSELLSHTSGLPDCTHVHGISDLSHTIKTPQLLAAINAERPSAPPGTVFAHNICNDLISALIVERVSRVPLSDYLQQHIFLPLVMDASLNAGDSGIDPSYAYGYTGNPNHFVPAHPWDASWLSGNGVVTDVYDLGKWDIGFPLLLRVDAVRDMFTPALTSGEEHHGLGWVIDQREGKRYVWQNGEIPGYRAMNALLPDDHIAVIVLTNTDAIESRAVVEPEVVAGEILDILTPPQSAHVENTVVLRAREWLERLATKQIDRTQLTVAFSKYLSDEMVDRADFASIGKPQTIIPIMSTTGTDGSTVYEFLVRYRSVQYHYRFSVTKDGKIDDLVLAP